MLSNLENLVRQRLEAYFASNAYQSKTENRFVSLQIVLRDIATGVKSKAVATYGLSLPTNEQIDRITDCSTCPNKAAQTSAARMVCENFATNWLRFSKPKTGGDGVNLTKDRGNATPKTVAPKSNEKPPVQVFFNIQAFKKTDE